MNDTEYPFETPAVKSAFAAFPEYERNALMSIRELIFTTAKKTKGSLDMNDLRQDERRKITCGRKHFEDALGTSYQVVTEAGQLPNGGV